MTDFRGAEDGARDHYPYITRSLLQLYDEGALTNVTDVIVEPDYGHVARITYTDGSHRVTFGNDLGLNSAAAGELARDEGRDTRINIEDPRILTYLQKQGVNLSHIPSANKEIVLAAVSNLSTGGTSEDVTETIASRWVDLAAFVARNFSLRLCGLDLACDDITDSRAEYSVIEVNAAPGLDHYASSGEAQTRVVRELYTKVLNAFPAAVQ